MNTEEVKGRIKYCTSPDGRQTFITEEEYTLAEFERQFKNLFFIGFYK